MKTKNYIPNNLRLSRNNVNLFQTDVALKLGVKNTDRLSNWEKGEGFPSIINLFKISAIYGKYPHELYPDLYEAIVLAYGSSSPNACNQNMPEQESLLDT